MTDAAVTTGPSASQLSENIGDVLASIRRMISQDAGPASLPAANAPSAGASVEHPGVLRLGAAGQPVRPQPDAQQVRPAIHWTSGTAIPTQREELLARAQSWTRRQPPGPGSLRLGRDDLVSSGIADPDDTADCPKAAALVNIPLAGPVIAAPGATVQPPALQDAPAAFSSVHGPVLPDAASGAIPDPDAASRDMETAAIDLADRVSTPIPSLSETILMELSMNAYAPQQPIPDHGPFPDDDGTLAGSIVSTMIRDAIRQELGDPSGRMSRDLRTMILREVANAITGEAGKRT